MARLRINGVEEEVTAKTVAELLTARGIDPTARFLSDPSRRFVNNGWINGGVSQPLVSNCVDTTVRSTPPASAAPARGARSFRRR